MGIVFLSFWATAGSLSPFRSTSRNRYTDPSRLDYGSTVAIIHGFTDDDDSIFDPEIVVTNPEA